MNPEEDGYETWIDYWVRTGGRPSPLDCPARFMKPGSEKSGFVKGWIKANSEFMEEDKPQPQPRPPQAP